MSRFGSGMPEGRGKTPAVDYTPSQSDINWALNLINMVADGATWGVPGNLSIYTLDKTTKELRLVQGELDDWFYNNIILFGKIGYKVIDARGTLPIPNMN